VDQYLFSPEERVALEGTMERVWRRGRWLLPFFWLATWPELLFPETGVDVPVTVDIRQSGARPCHVWRRSFRFPNRHRRFTSRMEYDERLVAFWRRLGRAGRLRSPGRCGSSRHRRYTWMRPGGCYDSGR